MQRMIANREIRWDGGSAPEIIGAEEVFEAEDHIACALFGSGAARLAPGVAEPEWVSARKRFTTAEGREVRAFVPPETLAAYDRGATR
jgi:hypothetical protein